MVNSKLYGIAFYFCFETFVELLLKVETTLAIEFALEVSSFLLWYAIDAHILLGTRTPSSSKVGNPP
jgi:hypothetical protein